MLLGKVRPPLIYAQTHCLYPTKSAKPVLLQTRGNYSPAPPKKMFNSGIHFIFYESTEKDMVEYLSLLTCDL